MGSHATRNGDVDHTEVAVKLHVALAVPLTAFVGRRRTRCGGTVPTGPAHAVGGLALINMAVAALW